MARTIDVDEIYTKIGHNIKVLRKNLRVSQSTLAQKIGSTRNYVGCIERAEKHATVGVLANIAYILGVELADIVKGCWFKARC